MPRGKYKRVQKHLKNLSPDRKAIGGYEALRKPTKRERELDDAASRGYTRGFEEACKVRDAEDIKRGTSDAAVRRQAVTTMLSAAGQYLAECAKILMSEKNQL